MALDIFYEPKRLLFAAGKPGSLVYHRLDLLPTDRTCVHLKQLATMDSAALFLAANSFSSPYEYLSQEESKKMVQVVMLSEESEEEEQEDEDQKDVYTFIRP